MENKKVTKTAKKTTKKVVKKPTTKKKTKSNSKKKKGFTLIELLAVIIILGILMIIAIPSVTKYINDSRKSAYVDTAKEIVSGTRNIVNEGRLGMYDTGTTYYIPAKYINTENSLKSPYGEFTDTSAYVGVIYDGTGYKYYWISSDDAGQGIDEVTPVDKLDTDDIKSDLDPNSILDKIKITGIGDRPYIKILNSNGNWDDYNAEDSVEEDGNTSSGGYTGYAYLYNERGTTLVGNKLDNERRTIWCATNNTEESYYCAIWDDYYTEQECLDYISQFAPNTYSCVARERLYDEQLLYYELNKIPFYRPYYIKLQIKNDVLINAWNCVSVDNQEYCFKWSSNGETYASNIAVLENIHSSFGYCGEENNYYVCRSGVNRDLYYISIHNNYIGSGNYWGGFCEVSDYRVMCGD